MRITKWEETVVNKKTWKNSESRMESSCPKEANDVREYFYMCIYFLSIISCIQYFTHTPHSYFNTIILKESIPTKILSWTNKQTCLKVPYILSSFLCLFVSIFSLCLNNNSSFPYYSLPLHTIYDNQFSLTSLHKCNYTVGLGNGWQNKRPCPQFKS